MQRLIHEGVPLLAEDWGSFSEAQMIHDLVHLTFALNHLGDRLAWLSFLRSPMLQFSLDDLYLVASNARKISIWQVLHDESVVHLLSDTAKLHLARMLDVVDPVLFNANFILLNKVQLVFNALTEGFAFTSLQENMIMQYWGFLARMPVLYSYQEFNQALALLKLNYQDANARVQLLTIHQSKGLEFDYVFLPHLNQGVRRSDPPLLRWSEFHLEGQFRLLLGLHKSAEGEQDPVYQYLHWLSKEEEANEQVRLLYVALTRAKKGLFLSYFKDADAKEFKPRAGSFLKLLNLSPEGF
jgi:ATP-dependent exoDNAse (exonuclease V) beta subunit